MPTKLRVILRQEGSPIFSGSRAVRALSSLVKTWAIPWPVDWIHWTMKDKLTFLGRYLPQGCELLLIRERKHTRKNKSLYLRTIGAQPGSGRRRGRRRPSLLSTGFREATQQPAPPPTPGVSYSSYYTTTLGANPWEVFTENTPVVPEYPIEAPLPLQHSEPSPAPGPRTASVSNVPSYFDADTQRRMYLDLDATAQERPRLSRRSNAID